MVAKSGNFYYQGLDSFRGIGILWIMCAHFFPYPFFKFGWISLEVFFVLSGFLITKVILNSVERPHYFRNFYARRALRIFPIYYLFLTVFFLVLLVFTKKESYQYLRNNYLYYFVYLQNFLFVFKGLEPENYLSHLWSLAMEEQFYFLWPVTVYLVRDLKKLKKILVVVIILAFLTRLFVWYRWGNRFETYHCNTFARIDTIAFGCLLGCGFSYNQLSKPLRIMVIILCTAVFPAGILLFNNFWFTNPLFATVGYTAISVLTIFFIEYFITEKTKFRFLKTNWLINYIGQISYSMYLFHVPVYFMISFKSGLPSVYAAILSIIIVFFMAAVSYKYYETPFLKLKARFESPAHAKAIVEV